MLYRKIDDTGLFVEDILLDTIPILMETVPETTTDPITGEETEVMVEKPVMKQIPIVSIDPETGEEIPTTREETIPDPHYIETPCPSGFYRPKWNGTAWIEGGQAPEPVIQPPSDSERIKALEDGLLVMMGGTL